MEKLNLKNITLLGLDTEDKDRLMRAFEICENYADFGAKKLLTKVDSEYFTESGIQIMNVNINSVEDYSKFMIKKLNNYVNTDFVLIIQYDGFILNPEGWTDEFLKHDYIGAPWWYTDDCNVGNGGFSLRSKRLLEILQKDENIKEYHGEDHNICRTYGPYLKNKGIKFAPEKIAKTFSIEGALEPPAMPVKYGSKWTNEFGFHGIHKTDISSWKNPLKNKIRLNQEKRRLELI